MHPRKASKADGHATRFLKKSLKAKNLPRKRSTPSICLPSESDLKKNCRQIVVELRRAYRSCVKGYREELRRVIAKGCAVATFLQHDQDAWSEFCLDEYWRKRNRKPNPKRPKEALRFVLLRVSGPGVEAEKRASKWFQAVKPLVEQGVKPSDIPNEIEEGGGIEELARESARRRKEGRSAERTAPEKKLPAATKKRRGAAIKREPAANSSTFVDLRARLVEEGREFLSLPTDAWARLTIRMRGSESSKFEIEILDMKRFPPPLL